MLTTLLYLLILALLGLILHWYYVYWFKFLKSCPQLAYPKPWPIIGNYLDIVPLTDFSQHLVAIRRRLKAKTFKGLVGFDMLVFTTSEKFIEMLATSRDLLPKSDEYDALRPWLNDGLLTSSGKKWTKRRKLLTPSFHFNILEDFISIFNSCSNILVDKLQSEVRNDSTDLQPFVTLCTLDVIYESTMGVKVDAQLKEHSEYVKMVKLEARIAFEKGTDVFKRSPLLFKFTKDYWKEKKALKVLHETTEKIITTRRELLLSNNKNILKKRRSFLDILLESTVDGEPLSNLDIREEVDTFLFEGHDTTTSAITFALYELSLNPHVQAKAVEELHAIFGNDKSKDATLQDLQEMRYLDLVIKETLRKYPSVPVFGRKCEVDIEYDGMTVPKGTSVFVLPYTLHREPETFPDPEKFDPDRFLPENKANIGPYAYIPFSAGYRNCIGQKFAMLELKSILSKLLRNFELRPVKNFEPRIVSEAVLRSRNGILVKLKRRI